MSTLRTNSVLTSDGTKTLLSSTGSIVQVVHYNYSSVYERFGPSGSESDLPGNLSAASIVPRNSTSRILFTAVIHCGQEDTWRGEFFRTYYNIGGGGWNNFAGGFGGIPYVSGYNGLLQSVTTEFLLPSLGTTSTVTFKITYQGSDGSSGYLHLNQNNTGNSGGANNWANCSSSITLKEVTA